VTHVFVSHFAVLMREVVRRMTLGDGARLDAMQVAPQWGMSPCSWPCSSPVWRPSRG
jgi:hypothetical protein